MNKDHLTYHNSFLSMKYLHDLNFKNKKRSIKLHTILEKQVKQYLDSLDENLRALVSKNQLIKSREKVYIWHRSNQNYIEYDNSDLSKYLILDCEPLELEEPLIPEPKRAKTNKSCQFSKILSGYTFEQKIKIEKPVLQQTTKSIGTLNMSFSEWLRQWNKLFDSPNKNETKEKSGVQQIREYLLDIKNKMGEDACKLILSFK